MLVRLFEGDGRRTQPVCKLGYKTVCNRCLSKPLIGASVCLPDITKSDRTGSVWAGAKLARSASRPNTLGASNEEAANEEAANVGAANVEASKPSRSFGLRGVVSILGCTLLMASCSDGSSALSSATDTGSKGEVTSVVDEQLPSPLAGFVAELTKPQVRRIFFERPVTSGSTSLSSDSVGLSPYTQPEPQPKPQPEPQPEPGAVQSVPPLNAAYDPHAAVLPTGGLNRQSDPHLMPRAPKVGISVHETPLRTALTRVTTNGRLGVPNGRARHNYSKQQAWNADETLLDAGGRLIVMSDYSVLPSTIALSRARNWSNLDPNLMYGIRFVGNRSNEFVRYFARERRSEVIRRFDGFETCRMGDGEGNLTNDDRFVALACSRSGQPPTLISFDISNNKILGQMQLDHDYNWAGFSQSGEFVVVEYSNGSSIDNQLLIFNRNLDHLRTVRNNIEHGDLGYDVDGNEVYVMIDALEMSYIELKSGQRRTLSLQDSGTLFNHGHVSCRNIHRPGWCYFSNGDGSVGAVKIATPGVVELWGFHRSSGVSYDASPKASVSPSGNQVVFTSDWYGTDEVNDYVLQVR